MEIVKVAFSFNKEACCKHGSFSEALSSMFSGDICREFATPAFQQQPAQILITNICRQDPYLESCRIIRLHFYKYNRRSVSSWFRQRHLEVVDLKDDLNTFIF
jgi:hypothetical protein